MAFTSESILTFGTSPVSFAVVTLLNYSMQNEKAGVFNTRRKETVSLEGLFSNVGVNLPITEHFSQIRSLIQASDDFLDLKLNGVSYGKAKFTSFSFPTSVGFDQNAARFSKFTIQLEIVKEEVKTKIAKRVPPGDRWQPLDNPQVTLQSLTEVLEYVYQKTGNTQFYMDAREGFTYIIDTEE